MVNLFIIKNYSFLNTQKMSNSKLHNMSEKEKSAQSAQCHNFRFCMNFTQKLIKQGIINYISTIEHMK